MSDLCLELGGEVDASCELAEGHDGPHQFSIQWEKFGRVLNTHASQWESDDDE